MAQKGEKTSEETKLRQREAAYRRWGSTEELRRLRDARPKKPKGFQVGNQLGKSNVGRRRTFPPEHRHKISIAAQRRKLELGYVVAPGVRLKMIETRRQNWKGHSEETRRKISEAHKGRNPPQISAAGRERIRLSKLGKSNYKIKGPNHYRWKGGITTENQRIRASLEYRAWRRAVFERDGYLCVIGDKAHGHKLHADHILPFAQYPEHRFDVSNGRTLCEDCHRATETWGNRKVKVA